MRLLSWNCQKLRNPWIGRNFHKLMREQASNVCFFMETRLDKEGFEKLYDNLPFPNQIIVKNPDSGEGITLIWKNEVALEVINFTANHVLAKIVEDDGFVWFITCFYGWLETNQREKSWKLLAHLKTFVDGPWLCIGDSMLFCMHQKNRASGRHNQHRWMLLGMCWNYVNLKTWAIGITHLLGVIRGLERQTQKSALIEL